MLERRKARLETRDYDMVRVNNERYIIVQVLERAFDGSIIDCRQLESLQFTMSVYDACWWLLDLTRQK